MNDFDRLMPGTASVLGRIFEALRAEYGPQCWWPAQTRFEILVGAVLTQNTAWKNVEHALGNLRACAVLAPEKILALPPNRLAELLRPSGCYNVKCRRLRALCQWLLDSGGFASLGLLSTQDLRRSLLAVHGVGPETADAILLYGFSHPVFVADAYCRRIFTRVGVIGGQESYENIRSLFETHLKYCAEDYNEFHALIVEHAKRACAKEPRCKACCIRRQCRFAIGKI